MSLLLLLIIFLIIVFTIFIFKKSLAVAMIVGIIATIILYRFNFNKIIDTSLLALSNPSSLQVVAITYIVTVLQRLLEGQDVFKKAQNHIFNIFSSNRKATMIAPILMGPLPAISAIYMAAAMVEDSVKDKLNNVDKTYITAYYRHCFEGILPVYGSVIIAITLAKISATSFVITMLPLSILFCIVGYFYVIKKLPLEKTNKVDKLNDIVHLIKNLYPIIIIIFLALFLHINIILSSIISILLYCIIERITIKNLLAKIKDGFEFKILITTFLLLIFKDFINATNINEVLPQLINNSFIPPIIFFIILTIILTFLLGNSASHALLIPLAIIQLKENPIAIAILINGISFFTMQIAPSHLCLYLASEYFDIKLIQLLKKSAIPALFLIVCAILYYFLLIRII
ncbi:MAG: DUF401 family protein [Bacilli bacterium]|jgi:integral membrane protein (TIGR00529 family)|nr:DUF401 family protein [Bacilli bacterium]